MTGSFRNSCDVFPHNQTGSYNYTARKIALKTKFLICFSSRESSNSQTWLIPVSADWLFIFHWSWEGSSIYFGEAQLALWEGGEDSWKRQISQSPLCGLIGVIHGVTLDQQFGKCTLLTQSLLCVKAHQQLWWNIGVKCSFATALSYFGWWKGK